MKLYKYTILAALALLLGLVSCQKDELKEAKAVMTSSRYLEFEAQNAAPQTLRVVSDAEWKVVTPDWVTVTPSKGSGDMEVTIEVADNVREGAVDVPRKETITFVAATMDGSAIVTIDQKGDKFRDLVATTIEESLEKPLEFFVQVSTSQVVALTEKGFIVSDNTGLVYVALRDNADLETERPALGAKIRFYGYVGKVNGLSAIVDCEEIHEVEAPTPVTYPEPEDKTAGFDAYTSVGINYIKLSGVLTGNELLVNEATSKKCLLYYPLASLNVQDLDYHKVDMLAYTVGSVGSTTYVVPVSFDDNGPLVKVYFQDNFDWITENWPDVSIGDSMGKKSDDSARNAYTYGPLEGKFPAIFGELGYEDLFPSSQTIYLQSTYLKFSKTSNVNGIRLPKLNIGGTTSVDLSFKWGAHVGGGGADKVEIVVELEGNGTVVGGQGNKSNPKPHTAGDWTWQEETYTLQGIDGSTRIVLRPEAFTGEVDATKTYFRWYLDDILISLAAGATDPGEGSGEGGTTEPAEPVSLAKWSFAPSTEMVADVNYSTTGRWYKSDDLQSTITNVRAVAPSKENMTYYDDVKEGYTRILCYGVSKDDYWLFEVPIKDQPAGTYTLKFQQGSSGTGAKFFIIEGSIDGGSNWMPFNTTTTTESYTTDPVTSKDVTYTYALSYETNLANEILEVSESATLPAIPGDNVLMIRTRVSDDMKLNRTGDMVPGHGGTNRLVRHAELIFQAN